MPAQTRSLPRPRRERWQPLRSGFVNLYRYDCEEFHYENGRLLLRGNNGTGKSRVLALQLPFLLDGDVAAQRLEPDADPSKRIEWNLLMDRYSDRTGYTWIEFGRYDEAGKAEGAEQYLTLGCGLSAVQGQAGVRQWFFITSRRIGEDLQLVSDGRQVIGRERLREKIGAAGQVFESAGPYRRAVDEALFQLGEHRYASLINLLIQLRRPQLTRRLEEHELSRALGEALPPVSPAIIAKLANAFRSLQSDRTQLNSSRAALAAVERFLDGYRRYAATAARRRADRVIAAHHEYEAGMKEVLNAEAECDRALAELARLKAELQRLADEEHALRAEITAFEQSPEMRDAQSLEQVQRDVIDRRRHAERAAAELADTVRLRKAWTDEHLRLRANLEKHQLRLESALHAAEQAARAAGLEDIHRNAFSAMGSPQPPLHENNICEAGESAIEQARETIETGIRAETGKVEHILALNERVASARNQLQLAGAERDQISGLLDDVRERLSGAREKHRSAVSSFLAAVSDWTADLTELPLPYDDVFLKSVTEWCEMPQGPNPFSAASRRALDELTREFAGKRAYLNQLEGIRTDELNRLEAEHERLRTADSLDEAEQARILSLQASIAEAHTSIDSIMDSVDELNRREIRLRSEAEAAPAEDEVRAAYDYSTVLARHLDGLRSRLAEAEDSLRQKQTRLDDAARVRGRDAADLGIEQWIDNPYSLTAAIAEYRLALSSVWFTAELFREARASVDRSWSLLEETAAREARQKAVAEEFERRAIAAEITRDAAARTAMGGFEEILDRIAQTRGRIEQLHVQEKELRRRYHDTEVAVTRVDERLRSRTEILNRQNDRREAAASALLTFAGAGLLRLAVPEMPDVETLPSSAARPVELALELASRLASTDAGDRAWEQYQKSVPQQFNTLMQELSAQGCESSASFSDDVFVAAAVFGGEEQTIDELRRLLFDDVTARSMLLEAREREILENHLAGELSAHLRELIHQAEEQVRQMNCELDSRPMSTGMKLRFVWRPADDAPAGMIQVRNHLMQTHDAGSAEQRQMLGSFLQRQIQTACSDIDGVTWQESLADALDYRKWHSFGVERLQEGVWKRLTRRTYGTGSGGEKAVALTVPHFAAAAAFYRTAHALAPRLILLDEAFVGIDADMRGKCMGLIDTFDLDFIMTSEREWGCYQTLPGIAIYQLSTRPGIDAIGLTRWVWNGRSRDLAINADSPEVANGRYRTSAAAAGG